MALERGGWAEGFVRAWWDASIARGDLIQSAQGWQLAAHEEQEILQAIELKRPSEAEAKAALVSVMFPGDMLKNAQLVLGTCAPATNAPANGRISCSILLRSPGATVEGRVDFYRRGKRWRASQATSASDRLSFPDPLLSNDERLLRRTPNFGLVPLRRRSDRLRVHGRLRKAGLPRLVDCHGAPATTAAVLNRNRVLQGRVRAETDVLHVLRSDQDRPRPTQAP